MKIYQAGPLFTEAEQNWHRKFKACLESAGHIVVWPGELIEPADIEEWGIDAPRRIMETDRDAMLSCDVVVALLDGVQVDDGTAWEIGFSFARGIPAVGIRTDFRQAGDTAHSRVNAMIEGSLLGIGRGVEDVLAMLKKLSQPPEQFPLR